MSIDKMDKKIVNDSQNSNGLSRDALNLIAWIFENKTVGWTKCYAVEVKLDDPIFHIIEGGDGLVTHGGNGSRDYYNNRNDQEWAIIHVEDVTWQSMINEYKNKFHDMVSAANLFIQNYLKEAAHGAVPQEAGDS